jgi:Tol biopolymer transport system component
VAKLSLCALAIVVGLTVAAASGGGSRAPTLLFARGLPCQGSFRTDLYSVRADGTALRRLTRDGLDLFGRWSTDGSSIFVLRGNGDCTSAFTSDVFELRADGSALRRITHSNSDPIDFAVAPDGKRLALDIRSKLVVTDIDGSHARTLAQAAAGVEPVWSPDSRRILYDSPGGLRVIDADGRGPGRVIGQLAQDEFHTVAAWSPGGLIVYVGRGSRLWLVRPNGSGRTRLTTGRTGQTDDFPAWSPDGTRILFVRTNAHTAVMVLTLAGRRLRTLVTSGSSPAWSPDGSSIAFEADSGISTVRPDGSDLRAVTHDSTDSDPRWRP